MQMTRAFLLPSKSAPNLKPSRVQLDEVERGMESEFGPYEWTRAPLGNPYGVYIQDDGTIAGQPDPSGSGFQPASDSERKRTEAGLPSNWLQF